MDNQPKSKFSKPALSEMLVELIGRRECSFENEAPTHRSYSNEEIKENARLEHQARHAGELQQLKLIVAEIQDLPIKKKNELIDYFYRKYQEFDLVVLLAAPHFLTFRYN